MKQAAEPPASKNNAGKDFLHIRLCYCKLTANTVFALVIILCQSSFIYLHLSTMDWLKFFSVIAERYPISGTGYLADTLFHIKRNPDLNLCYSRFAGTPFCKMFSGGWATTSIGQKSNQNSKARSVCRLLWAQSKSNFNFVNTEVGHFLYGCELSQLLTNASSNNLQEGYIACEIIQPVRDCDSCFCSWCKLLLLLYFRRWGSRPNFQCKRAC